MKKDNANWPQIPDHPYRTLIIEGFRSGKTISLFSLISHQPDTDQIYLYTKNPFGAKYQLLINKAESAGLKHLNDFEAFIEYSNNIDDIYKNIEQYNPNKKRKILIVFDDMIADMLSNKNLYPMVTELFIRCTKINISLGFYYIILFFCTKKYYAKFYTILYYENSKQTRTSTNLI